MRKANEMGTLRTQIWKASVFRSDLTKNHFSSVTRALFCIDLSDPGAAKEYFSMLSLLPPSLTHLNILLLRVPTEIRAGCGEGDSNLDGASAGTPLSRNFFASDHATTRIQIRVGEEHAECGVVSGLFCQDSNLHTVEVTLLGLSALEPNEAAARIRWSWGDPQRRVAGSLEGFEKHWDQRSTAGSLSLLDAVLKSWETANAEVINGITLFKHQSDALDQWEFNGFRGIFKMCTGAGKTITALAGMKRLQRSLEQEGKELRTVVIACPTQVLVEQWHQEIDAFGFETVPLLAYESRDRYVQSLGVYLDGTRHTGLRIVVTTYVTLVDTAFEHQLRMAQENGAQSLIIADEMHNCAPSRIREYLHRNEAFFPYRLGLSATPEVEGNLSATTQLFDYFGGIQSEYLLATAIRDNVLCEYDYFPHPVLGSAELGAGHFPVVRA